MQGTDMCFVLMDDGQQRMTAHKEIVCDASPVLDCILNGSGMLRGRDSDTIEVEGIQAEAFREMLFYMYFKTAVVTKKNAFELLHISAYYGLHELNAKCRHVLAYTHATNRHLCLKLFDHIYNIDPYGDLEQHCLRLMRYDPKRVVFDQADVWPYLPDAAARELLMSDPIDCDEDDLFVGIVERAKQRHSATAAATSDADDCPPTPEQLLQRAAAIRDCCDDLLECVRWSTMTSEQLQRCIQYVPHFFSSDEVAAMRDKPVSSMVRKRRRMTTRDHIWLPQRKLNLLMPSAVHGISRAKRAPEYVGLRSCGNHRHVVGYSQKGPMEYMVHLTESQIPADLYKYEVLLGTGFKWRNVLPGCGIPVGAVAVPRGPGRRTAAMEAALSYTDLRHDPLYIGRVAGRFVGMIDWYGRVCRRAPMNSQCIIDGYADEDIRWSRHSSDLFQVLVGRHAVKPHLFGVPPIPALNMNSAASPVYLARAMLLNDIVPVSVDMIDMVRRPMLSGHNQKFYDYDIVRLHARDVKWVKSANGARVPLAVLGGRTKTSDKLYVGRVLNAADGKWLLGKVWPRRKNMFTGYGNLEVAHNQYEILVFKKAARANDYHKRMWNE